jgi:hypothetical protein
MTEISDDLKSKALAYYEQNKQLLRQYAELARPQRSYLVFPILIDGVLGQIRWNVKEERLDRITVAVSSGGNITVSDMLPDGAAYTDKVEFVDIEIPPGDPPATLLGLPIVYSDKRLDGFITLGNF